MTLAVLAIFFGLYSLLGCTAIKMAIQQQEFGERQKLYARAHLATGALALLAGFSMIIS
jgi:hypothetical protein